MRQILVDHARRRQAKKRRAAGAIPFSETLEPSSGPAMNIVALDQALGRLSSIDNRKSALVEMRFFGGMTAEEIAECVSIPVHTVRRELRIAQAWLHKELTP
jgi:RNA polymerase sigma factor (TIGR02999 family)